MPITEVTSSPSKMRLILPVSGAGADVPAGTPLMRGATAGTNKGIAIPITASSNARCLGLLCGLHDYSVVGDCLTQTLANWYPGFTTTPPAQEVELLDTATLVKMDYAISTATQVAVASATSTVLTITSTEADLDGGWAYVMAGIGIGQLAYIKSSTTAAWTVNTMGTTCDSTSKLIKILPLFYDTPTFLINTATQATLLDSIAAIGTGRAVVLEQIINKNGKKDLMDPSGFNANTGLNSLSILSFQATLAFVDSVFHPVS